MACSTFSASKRPSTTIGIPTARSRTPDSGPVWYIGPITRWVRYAAKAFLASASTCSVMLSPPANIVGGSSTPFGRPVVPDVYIRLGRGGEVDGRLVRAGRSEPLVPGRETRELRAAPPDDHRYAGLLGGGEAGGHRLGTDEQRARRVREDVGQLLGVEVEVPGTVETPASSPPRWASTVSALLSANTA